MNHNWPTGLAVVVTAMAVQTACAGRPAHGAEAPPARRARPPVWTADVRDVFFEDARNHLVGERPVATSAGAGDQAVASQSNPKTTPQASAPATSGELPWSQLIDGETLVDEVKRIANALREPLATAGKFKAGGYQQCRADFSMLAVLFGVISDHDGEVRWSEDAPVLRDAIARAASNCKVGTDQTYQEATQRKAQLDDLVRGEHPGGKSEPLESWSLLADRPLLMQRMEEIMESALSPTLANPREFSRRVVDVKRNAQLLAMLADVIQREGYEYWDDELFQEQADELRAAAVELTRSAAEANYEAARTASQRAAAACVNCHAGYRG